MPADPRPYRVTQPDGSELIVRKVGDERAHFNVDERGRLVAFGEDGVCYYARLNQAGLPEATKVAAKADESAVENPEQYSASVLIPKSLEMRAGSIRENAANKAFATRASNWNNTNCKDPNFRMLMTNFPSTGNNKALVILAEFSDLAFTVENPKQHFTDLLNKEGYSANGCEGSARDFFKKSSMGQFVPEFDVYGPVKLPQTMKYYGGNGDRNAHLMIRDACQLLDNEIDFSQYDLDNDGYVDNVYVFYAGLGEADNPETSTQYTNTVWPHAWNLYLAAGVYLNLDGKIIDHYACSNELRGVYSDYPKRPVGIGTLVHEFSHVMGLPDLYAIDYNSSYTPGSWSTLDSGPYNADGCVPPIYSSFERFSLGWLKPKQFGATKDYTLKHIEESNEAYIVYTEKPAEFFLFENRQQAGWDKYLMGHGMLVWHVDFSQNVWNNNVVNNTPNHQYVDIVEANGNSSELTNPNYEALRRREEAFPGEKNYTELSFTSKPAKLASWGGKSTIIGLKNIRENDGIITVSAENAENPTDVDPNAGIDGVSAEKGTLRVWSGEGMIFASEPAAVYTLTGAKIGTASAEKGISVAPGIYVATAGGRSAKIAVK